MASLRTIIILFQIQTEMFSYLIVMTKKIFQVQKYPTLRIITFVCHRSRPQLYSLKGGLTP